MSFTVEPSSDVSMSQNPSRLAAFFELTKPRISTMVMITIVVAAFVSSPADIDVWMLLNVALGMSLVAASGNAMNMYLERYSDFLMPRTVTRPLPDKRLTSNDVANFSAITIGSGLAYLFFMTNWQTAVVALATWILYVFVYTPLKPITPLNTEVGAVAGAMPVICGSLGASQSVEPFGLGLFFMLLFWQFPHFMAIAWIYRNQYREGGLKMLTVTEPTGKAAGRKAIVMAFTTWAGSLVPLLAIERSSIFWAFAVTATALASIYIFHSWQFAKDRNDQTARKLLMVSIIYLPLYMVALIVFSKYQTG